MNILVLAIPVFLFFLLLEIVINFVKKTDYYQVNDTINSISIGIISRIINVLLLIIPFSIYSYCFENFSVMTWSNEHWFTWLVAFVLYDFFYYWYHRYAHEINMLWASHVVHHQSEEYNLSTALRQSSTGAWFGWFFYIPMALLGFNPVITLTVGGLNLIYQFFVHTQLVGKLAPWLEAIFVTPSLHGVHHGQNARYIDKNYAGVFILWDRIFNTYQVELDDEKPVYGVRKPLSSWNPFWANIEPYYRLAEDAWHTKSWRDKIAIWFKPTGWRPDDVIKTVPRKYTNPKNLIKFDVKLSRVANIYVTLQHSIIIALSIYFLVLAPSLMLDTTLLVSGTLLLSMIILSLVQENRLWNIMFEGIRVMITFAFVFQLVDMLSWQLFCVIVFLLSVVLLFSVHSTKYVEQSKLSTNSGS